MIGSMIGTIVNIVLDPVMITGLHMGAAGAAIATNDRKYSGKFILCMVFPKEKQMFFHPSKIF